MRHADRLRLAALLSTLSASLLAGAQTSPPAPAAPAAKAAAAKPRPAALPARTQRHEKNGFTYLVEPVPAWVVPAKERANIPVDRAAMHYRVIDEQLRVDDNGGEDYNHVVRVVDDAAGLSVAAQIELEFDPAYQTLVLHHIDVLRDGVRSTRLNPQRIQLLQRESQLERRMVDGRVTFALTVDDVRRGDEIDFAYSIRGGNPIFGKQYVRTTWLSSWRGPVATHQVRLLAPAQREIAQRIGDPGAEVSQQVANGWRETLIRRESAPQISNEDGAPWGELRHVQVQFSEFTDWAAVARWGTALFAEGARQPLLERKAEEIRAAHATPEARTLAALEFVQKDIRYFGTEIGVNSHRPAAPDKVIEQRFGDCKDKTGVLVALLRRLDIPVAPVLVSQSMRRDTALMQPSPLAFDHVIARVELGDQVLWLDATRNHQSGPLAVRSASPFQRGLILQAGSTELAALPAPWDELRVRVQDTLRFARIADEPQLESRITFRGDLAEGWREALATRPLETLTASLAEPYVKAYPKLRSTAPLRVEPVPDDDAVTLVQVFAIPDFWRFPEQRLLVGDLVAWAAVQPLVLPKTEKRRQALAFSLPGVYRHEVALEFPEDVARQPGSNRFEDGQGGITVRTGTKASTRRFELSGEARIGTDRIEPADWAAVNAKLAKTLPRLASTVSIPALALTQAQTVQARAKDLEESLRRGMIKVATRRQADAHFNTLLLGAQIDSGRLPPLLKAQALNARGIQLDNLGQYAKAQPDFEQALALAPDNVEYLNAAGVNAMGQGRYDRALELSARVLGASPRDTEALDLRARALYFKGDLAAASGALDEVFKDEQAVRRGYPLLWWSLTQRQLGLGASTAVARFPKAQWPTDWPRPLVEFVTGQTSAEALIAAAKTQKAPADALTEAYFYIAEAHLADGRNAQAVEFWKKTTEQGVVEFVEDAAARQRLAAQK